MFNELSKRSSLRSPYHYDLTSTELVTTPSTLTRSEITWKLMKSMTRIQSRGRAKQKSNQICHYIVPTRSHLGAPCACSCVFYIFSLYAPTFLGVSWPIHHKLSTWANPQRRVELPTKMCQDRVQLVCATHHPQTGFSWNPGDVTLKNKNEQLCIVGKLKDHSIPRHAMYGIFTYPHVGQLTYITRNHPTRQLNTTNTKTLSCHQFLIQGDAIGLPTSIQLIWAGQCFWHSHNKKHLQSLKNNHSKVDIPSNTLRNY